MNLKDINYIVYESDGKKQYIFLDSLEDTTIDFASNISKEPIDSTGGTSLQERAVRELISLGVSGSFSLRNKPRNITLPDNTSIILFNDYIGKIRLENIVVWFERALENAYIFTVCKKGVEYHNQLLNNVQLTFDDSFSKISISLSFIEVVFAEDKSNRGYCKLLSEQYILEQQERLKEKVMANNYKDYYYDLEGDKNIFIQASNK